MGDISSCVAIISNDSILMVRQTYKGETFWTFTGGKIEITETPLQCAIRETFEETGLQIEVIQKLIEFFNPRINGIFYCYLTRIVGGVPRLGFDPELSEDGQELIDLRWFPIKEMKSHPEVKRILECGKVLENQGFFILEA